MRVVFKITRQLFEFVQADLRRQHAFAAERVGWLRCRVGDGPAGALMILAHDYAPVDDGDYVNDQRVGAMMGSAAIRKALQEAYTRLVSMFHVHMHGHRGRPRFSGVDNRESAKVIPDFWHVSPEMPHGALVLSQDSIFGRCWYPGGQVVNIREVVIVGAPMVCIEEDYEQAARPSEFPRSEY
jgi:hypothetical protein